MDLTQAQLTSPMSAPFDMEELTVDWLMDDKEGSGFLPRLRIHCLLLRGTFKRTRVIRSEYYLLVFFWPFVQVP